MRVLNGLVVLAALSTVMIVSGVATAGIIVYLPITLTNNQLVNSANGLQVSVSFNSMNAILLPYEANDLGNIRFYQSNAPTNPANELYSWCQGGCNAISTNSTFWIKVSNSVWATANLPTGIGIYKTSGLGPNSGVDKNGVGALSVNTLDNGRAPFYICVGATNSYNVSTILFNTWTNSTPGGNATVGYSRNQSCSASYSEFAGVINYAAISAVGVTYPIHAFQSFYDFSPTSNTDSWTFSPYSTNELAVLAVGCGGEGCDFIRITNQTGNKNLVSNGNCTKLTSAFTPTDNQSESASTAIFSCYGMNHLDTYQVYLQNSTGFTLGQPVIGLYEFENPAREFIGNFNMTFLTTNTEYDGNVAGEAPQYTTTYAKYDNGKNVFNFYQNSNSIPTSNTAGFIWGFDGDTTFIDYPQNNLVINSIAGVQALVANSVGTVISNTIGADYFYMIPANNLPKSFVATLYGYTAGNDPNIAGTDEVVGMASNSAHNYGGYWNLYGENGGSSADLWWSDKSSTNDRVQLIPVIGSGAFPFNQWITSGLAYNSTNETLTSFEYNGLGLEANGVYTSARDTRTESFNNSVVFGGYIHPPHTQNIKYYGLVIVRSYPPSGIMPSASFGSLIPTAPLTFNAITSSPTLSNTLNPGQSITFNAFIYNGLGPYTYNYILSNTITGAIIETQSSATSLTYNSFTWVIPSSAAPNAIRANVVVTDVVPVTVNSVYLQTLFVVSTTTTSTSTTSTSSTTTVSQSGGINGNTGGYVPTTTATPTSAPTTTTSTTATTESTIPASTSTKTTVTSLSTIVATSLTTTIMPSESKSGINGAISNIIYAIQKDPIYLLGGLIIFIVVAAAVYLVTRRRRRRS